MKEPSGRLEFSDHVPSHPPILPEREWQDREKFVLRLVQDSILKDPEGKRSLTKILTEYDSQQGRDLRPDPEFMTAETFSKFMHDFAKVQLARAHHLDLKTWQADIQTWKAFVYSECLSIILQAMNEPVSGRERPGITRADDGQYYPTPFDENWRHDIASQMLSQIRVNAPQLLELMDSKKGGISRQEGWTIVAEAYCRKPTDLVQPRMWRELFSNHFSSPELKPIFERWLEQK